MQYNLMKPIVHNVDRPQVYRKLYQQMTTFLLAVSCTSPYTMQHYVMRPDSLGMVAGHESTGSYISGRH